MRNLFFRIVLAAIIFSLFNPPGQDPAFGTGIDFDPTPLLGQRWYGVYMMDNKVGYGSLLLSRITYEGEEAYQATFDIFYQISFFGQIQKMTLKEERTYLPERGLVAFKSENDSALGLTRFTGKRKGDQFEVTTPAGVKSVPAAPESLADYLADAILVKNKARVGETVKSVQFLPTLLKTVRIIHTVGKIETRFISGVPTRVYHINSDFPELGIQTLSLIDENLHTLEARVGTILTIREEGEAEAKNLDYKSDILLLTSVVPDKPVPSPRKARSLKLKLRGIKDSSLLISSPRQQFKRLDPETHLLCIDVQDYNPATAKQIPALVPELKPYLKPTVYIQSTHPRIQLLARQIAGEENNSYRVTEKLVDWVYQNLDKSFLAAIPNALDVLKKKSGDCKAHSILLVALARSLGLPARQVSGLVQTQDGKFYYHQWAETYVGKWLPVDPVFGDVNADATHIKLSQGDMFEQIKLLNLIGNISIEILEYTTDEGRGTPK